MMTNCCSTSARRIIIFHRTPILVTNQLQYARPADKIIYLGDWHVDDQTC